MRNDNRIKNIDDFRHHPFDPKTRAIDNRSKKDGDGPTMRDDYVTHEELHHVEDNLSNKIDKLELKIDGKFKDQKIWFLTTLISIALGTITILGFVMNWIINTSAK